MARDSILLAIAGVTFFSWGNLVGVVVGVVVTIGENLVNDMTLAAVGVDGLVGVPAATICSA